jgi:hypothetical protein
MIMKWGKKLFVPFMIKWFILDLERPKVVTDFNSWMGGVDLSDAYLTVLAYQNLWKALSSFD